MDFVWPLLIAGLILGLANELMALNTGVYIGMTLVQSLLSFGLSMFVTLVKFIILLFLVPLLLYRFEIMVFRIDGNLKRFSLLLALIGPLYATSILIKVLLDLLLPNNAFFKFIELIIPGLAVVYTFGIIFVGMRHYFKLADVKAAMIASLPWLIIFIYTMI